MNDSEPLIVCYGNPEEKHSPIKTILIRNENEGFEFTQKFDIVKDFLNNLKGFNAYSSLFVCNNCSYYFHFYQTMLHQSNYKAVLL